MPKGSGGRPCAARAAIEVGHAGARRGDGAQRRVAGGGSVALADRKYRQHAVADEFQHFAAEGVDGAGDAVEPGVERGDHRLRRRRLRQLGETAQIGIEQRRRGWSRRSRAATGRPAPAPRCAGRDRSRAARQASSARRGRRAARRQSAPTSRSSAVRLRSRGRGRSPAEHGAVPSRPTAPATSSCTTPVPSPASQSRPTLPARARPDCSEAEAQRLDHRSGVRAPQPCAARDDRMRRRQRQRAAGERQAVGDEPRAERRQEGSAPARRSPRRRARRGRRAVAWTDHAAGVGACHEDGEADFLRAGRAGSAYDCRSAASACVACRRRPPMDETADGQREIQIAAPPATVFAFLTDPDKIMRWLGTDATMEPHPGGIYLVNVGGKYIARGRVHRSHPGPPPRLQLRLGRARERAARIEPDRDRPDRQGTAARWCASPIAACPTRRNAPATKKGWDHYLRRLAIAAAGGDPGPDGPGRRGEERGHLAPVRRAVALQRLRSTLPPSVLPDISPARGEIGRPLWFRQSPTLQVGETLGDSRSPPCGGDVRQDRGGRDGRHAGRHGFPDPFLP